jgi:preprotein translocase subunit SecA
VHVVTVNDYLASYVTPSWMGRVHRFLGLRSA